MRVPRSMPALAQAKEEITQTHAGPYVKNCSSRRQKAGLGRRAKQIAASKSSNAESDKKMPGSRHDEIKYVLRLLRKP